MESTKYLNKQQKNKIEAMYKAYVEEGEKVRIPFISLSVNEPSYIVREHILKKYGEGAKDNIYACECDYLSDTGLYLRFTDYYQLYLHQYILIKELNLEADIIKKYVIHHIDEDKKNNELNNLYLFFNTHMHRTWHIVEEKFNHIKEFTLFYVNKELEHIADKEQTLETTKYEKELREYIQLVELLEQKKKTLESGISKAIG